MNQSNAPFGAEVAADQLAFEQDLEAVGRQVEGGEAVFDGRAGGEVDAREHLVDVDVRVQRDGVGIELGGAARARTSTCR